VLGLITSRPEVDDAKDECMGRGDLGWLGIGRAMRGARSRGSYDPVNLVPDPLTITILPFNFKLQGSHASPAGNGSDFHGTIAAPPLIATAAGT